MKGHFRPDGGRFADAYRAGGRTDLAEKSAILAGFVVRLCCQTIVRQEGRHLEARMVNPRSDNPWIGTLSADGKRLQVATPVADFAFQIEGDRMTGCGSGHTADGSSYTALCFDMIAMK